MAQPSPQNDLLSRLEQYQRRKSLVTILRDIDGIAPLDGFVLKASSQWVLMQYVDDFRLDGYCLFRTEDIDTIQHGKFERFREGVLTGEDLVAQVGRDCPKLNLKTLTTALNGLKQDGKLLTLLGEWPEVDFLAIGRLQSVGNDSAKLHVLSALGVWEKQLQEVALAAISLVTFDDHYVTTLAKHARGAGEPDPY